MTSDSAVARWLDDTASRQPPDTLLHPGDEFPLRTFSNPPSTSSLSDISSDDDAPRRTAAKSRQRPADIAKLVHPTTPTGATFGGMEQSTRRRSSSVTGTAAAASTKKERRHKRRRDDHIAEEGEDSSGNASDSGSRSDSSDNMSADGLDDDEETGLTKKVRRKNARRKRRNTLLENRIVPDAGLTFTKEEKALADQSLYRSMLINACLILLWCALPHWLARDTS